jgi:hypothetical protein
MSQKPLIELSFAEAVVMIAEASDLSAQTRRHWECSLRRMAQALDKPMEVIPARFSAVREALRQLHHVPLGLTAKTLSNHRSNTKAALLWLGKEHNIPRNGAPLTADWQRLHAQLGDPGTRTRLSPLMRYCSAQSIAPEAVDETVMAGYMEYRTKSTTRRSDDATRRVLARLWNANIGKIPGWPSSRLFEPPVKPHAGPAWEAFPEGLRQDIERYLDGLTRVRKNTAGQRMRPCKPSTIVTRRREFAAAARMAVKTGIPIESLTSLAALLDPKVVEQVLDAYWAQNGEEPTAFTIELACHLYAVAKATGCIDAEGCGTLANMRADLEDHRQGGMTDKNLAAIRQVLTDGVWSRVVNLPAQLMAEARSLHPHAPVKAAVLAQLAVAIAILSFAPVRLANLAAIELGQNLIKPGGPDSNYWLVFRGIDVKNRVNLKFPFGQRLTDLINEYVHDFRPSLTRGSNANWLFPGQAGTSKEKISFSTQIVKKIHKSIGLRITVHQFRHAAAALYLKHHTGDYQTVRLLLGHRSIETTIRFYCGLESTQASEVFSEIVLRHMNPDGEGTSP